MPEGDTIAWAASRLRPALEGHVPDEIRSPRNPRWPDRLGARAVRAIDTHGKHLFVRFEGDLVVHSHLGMAGSWRVSGYEPRSSRAWLTLRVGERWVAEHDGPVLELLTEARIRFDQRLSGLGPDVLAPEFDAERFLSRMHGDDPTRTIGDALLDQRNLAGIGNIWKAEGCWEASIDPWRPLGSVDRGRSAIGGGVDQAEDDALGCAGPARDRAPGLPPGRPPVPPLRHADPLKGSGRRQPHHVLVPGMSALEPPGSARSPSGLEGSARSSSRLHSVGPVPGRPAAVRRVGHKGADLIAPGNTLASFDAALEAGVDMIEFDVLPSREDGRLLLAHDHRDAAKRSPHSLEEGLAHLSAHRFDGVELDVDLKLPGYELRVVDALRKFRMLDRALISTQYRESLALIRSAEPSVRLGWTVPKLRRDPFRSRRTALPALVGLVVVRALLPGRAAAAIRRGQCDAMMVHWRLVTRRLVRRMERAGGELYVWTVDDPERLRVLQTLGVDGLITNDPRLFGSQP